LVGKVSAILKSIPGAVLGGIMLLLFGMIAATGVNNMVLNRTDMGNTRNLIIVSLILTTGIGGAVLRGREYQYDGYRSVGIDRSGPQSDSARNKGK